MSLGLSTSQRRVLAGRTASVAALAVEADAVVEAMFKKPLRIAGRALGGWMEARGARVPRNKGFFTEDFSLARVLAVQEISLCRSMK